MKFKDLDIIPQILRALENENYSTPTPIQEQAIPPILAGRDPIGYAQTDTGKTAASAFLVSRIERHMPGARIAYIV